MPGPDVLVTVILGKTSCGCCDSTQTITEVHREILDIRRREYVQVRNSCRAQRQLQGYSAPTNARRAPRQNHRAAAMSHDPLMTTARQS